MRTAIALFVAVVSLLVTGCGALVPTQHKEQVAVQTAGELSAHQQDNSTKRAALPNIIASGKESKVEITLPPSPKFSPVFESQSQSESEVASSGNDSAKGSTSTTIPLFVKLIGGAIGLFLLATAVFYVIRSVKAGAAGAAAAEAFNVADSHMASAIASVETMLQVTTDPGQKMLLLSQLATLNKGRGKMAAQAPAPAGAPSPAPGA